MIDLLNYSLNWVRAATEPEPLEPRPASPQTKERSAEQDPKQMCRAGEHGRCDGVDCGCWCHDERLDKQEDD